MHPGDQLTGDWRDSQSSDLGGLGIPFWHPGCAVGYLRHHFDGPEVPRDAQQDSLDSTPGFELILMDLGIRHLWSRFGDFSVTWTTKLEYGFQSWFFRELEWKSHTDALLGCAKRV